MKYFQSGPPPACFSSSSAPISGWGYGSPALAWRIGDYNIPGGFLLFAAVTGFCPGMIITRWLFKEK